MSLEFKNSNQMYVNHFKIEIEYDIPLEIQKDIAYIKDSETNRILIEKIIKMLDNYNSSNKKTCIELNSLLNKITENTGYFVNIPKDEYGINNDYAELDYYQISYYDSDGKEFDVYIKE